MPQLTVEQAMDYAVERHQAGAIAEAEAIYRQVLARQPNQPNALYLLGEIAYRRRHFEASRELNERAIALAPRAAHFHNGLALALKALERPGEAERAFRRAVELDPMLAMASVNLGNLLREAGRLDEALAVYQAALAHNPRDFAVHQGLALTLSAAGRLAEAIQSFETAYRLEPRSAEVIHNLGYALLEADRFDEALDYCARAVELLPDSSSAREHLAEALVWAGHIEEALEQYRRITALHPDLVSGFRGLALTLLLLGRYEEGWAHYEARLRLLPARDFSAPRWSRQPADGQTILLHCEQGLGDTLQLFRYAALVRERTKATRIILEAPSKLGRLLAHSVGGEVEIVALGDGNAAAPPAYDWQIPLLSLPFALGISQPLPMPRPYLTADPELRAAWRRRLGAKAGFRVGLAWQGNPEQVRDRLRSIPAASFLPLLHVEGAIFYSLQLDANGADAGPLQTVGLIDLTEHISDFADTAALIAELDLVIAVDTAVVHLAGALGRPVWTLLRFVPHWPWGLKGDSTPWYPTMRLFRQSRWGDWDSVLQRVREELAAATST